MKTTSVGLGLCTAKQRQCKPEWGPQKTRALPLWAPTLPWDPSRVCIALLRVYMYAWAFRIIMRSFTSRLADRTLLLLLLLLILIYRIWTGLSTFLWQFTLKRSIQWQHSCFSFSQRFLLSSYNLPFLEIFFSIAIYTPAKPYPLQSDHSVFGSHWQW